MIQISDRKESENVYEPKVREKDPPIRKEVTNWRYQSHQERTRQDRK
jgi:hypothetical protein